MIELTAFHGNLNQLSERHQSTHLVLTYTLREQFSVLRQVHKLLSSFFIFDSANNMYLVFAGQWAKLLGHTQQKDERDDMVE